jgi:DNA-directed RNA polymerase subunit RPC12/RpoP
MPNSYYQCQTCERKIIVKDSKKVPSCCGKPMRKVSADICLQPDHSEHARPMRDEEPCDDFRAGK